MLARPLLQPIVVRTCSRRGVWGSGSRVLQTIDLHAAGEPARVVTAGLPHVPGTTMAEKRVSRFASLRAISLAGHVHTFAASLAFDEGQRHTRTIAHDAESGVPYGSYGRPTQTFAPRAARLPLPER
jgi:hypothetical protein